jgi:peptidoglycan/xylan/chitin deacetylase (PgdA/CDA1 family)
MLYPVKTPFLFRWLYPHAVWRVDTSAPVVYLTFDDGPHPEITPWVLDMLDVWQAKATFFCIGKNVALYREVYDEVLRRGHRVGNHTHTHCNGWNTPYREYMESIRKAEEQIESNLFRPPYGRITPRQANGLRKHFPHLRPVMWDVLSGDFDRSVTGEQCGKRVIRHSEAGSVVVFHDSEKAFRCVKHALPFALEYFHKKNMHCRSIE